MHDAGRLDTSHVGWPRPLCLHAATPCSHACAILRMMCAAHGQLQGAAAAAGAAAQQMGSELEVKRLALEDLQRQATAAATAARRLKVGTHSSRMKWHAGKRQVGLGTSPCLVAGVQCLNTPTALPLCRRTVC